MRRQGVANATPTMLLCIAARGNPGRLQRMLERKKCSRETQTSTAFDLTKQPDQLMNGQAGSKFDAVTSQSWMVILACSTRLRQVDCRCRNFSPLSMMPLRRYCSSVSVTAPKAGLISDSALSKSAISTCTPHPACQTYTTGDIMTSASGDKHGSDLLQDFKAKRALC